MTTLDECLYSMHEKYQADPVKAVRGQGFIKLLHQYVGESLESRLTEEARKKGLRVTYEASILGSHKPKDVDVCVIDPSNGALVMVGIRSQMSSIGNNALNYYEGIIGECISLQDRFPMSTIGYIYLMPLRSIKEGKEDERIDHGRYAKMYAAITGREGQDYTRIRGIYDQFAYMVVDFVRDPPSLRNDLVRRAVMSPDLNIETFVDRMTETFNRRNIFVNYFK